MQNFKRLVVTLLILAAMCIHLDSFSIAYRKTIKSFEKENICTFALYSQLSILKRLILIMKKLNMKKEVATIQPPVPM